MRLSKMLRLLPVALLFVAVGACSESPSAPVADAADAAFAKGGHSGRPGSDSGAVSFWIYPHLPVSGSLGDHYLSIPANVVCDPVQSGYGPEYWDQPCTPASRPIRMTARWFVKNGHAQIHFTPDIRFAPSSNSARWVLLSMKQYEGDVTDASTIFWWSNSSKSWVDEALEDPLLTPWLDRGGNRVTRRVKHFSGYVVGTSRLDDGGTRGGDSGY